MKPNRPQNSTSLIGSMSETLQSMEASLKHTAQKFKKKKTPFLLVNTMKQVQSMVLFNGEKSYFNLKKKTFLFHTMR